MKIPLSNTFKKLDNVRDNNVRDIQEFFLGFWVLELYFLFI